MPLQVLLQPNMTHAVPTQETEVAKRCQDAYGMELSVLQVKEIHLLRLLLHPLRQFHVSPSAGQTNAMAWLTVTGLEAIVYHFLQVKEICLLLHPLYLLLHPLRQFHVSPSAGQTNAMAWLTVTGFKAIVYRSNNSHITIFYALMNRNLENNSCCTSW
mmetsp:Transcript_18371/g.27242  ORF Transcript_18371/g.27242 Transcript_18371/m.27242 type:complete len:158 (+) Transcript_18371:224-697(+)